MTWATKGSQLQMQLYVNRRADDLTAAVVASIPSLEGARIEWVAPVEPSFQEPRDEAFLDAVGLEHLAGELHRFWPSRGPVWDALGISHFAGGRKGVVLAEGKSYPSEMYAGGSRAGATGTTAALRNRERIREAISRTQKALGLPSDPDRWMSPLIEGKPSSSLYQTANRLAHTMWLQQNGVNAVLIHVLFVEDPTFPTQATTRAQWEEALATAASQLGINGLELPWLGHAFLPGLTAETAG